ncbi:MAG: toxin-antitoxin system HicB family antitoxin [Chloroflexi bacterium]|nr:toxin-antitoxin system HicB family antitoxin [Chloroflexota bacterium]
MSQSNVITLRVPLDLKHRLVRVAQAQGVSLNQLAIYALTKEITLMESSAVQLYLKQSDEELQQGFEAVMAKVGHGHIPEWDKLPA